MKQRPRIVVTNRIHPEVAARLKAVGDLVENQDSAPMPAERLRKELRTASALMGFMTDTIDHSVIANAEALRIVACALKGYDSYDVDACTAAGIWVSIVPDLLTEPTAELAVGLAIGLARHIRAADTYMRSGAFEGWRAQLYGTGLADSTVAIVGLGRVGLAIAHRLSGFGCSRLLAVDPAGAPDCSIEKVSLRDALAVSDYVFVAVPLLTTTRHMISACELAQSKTGQLLINVGRGSVIDELAVAAALESGKLGGYAADVFEMEDWALADRPPRIPELLLRSGKTLLTPHIGSAVARVRLAIEHRAADNIIAALESRRPPDAINVIAAQQHGDH